MNPDTVTETAETSSAEPQYKIAPQLYYGGAFLPKVQTKYLAVAPPGLDHLPSVIPAAWRSEFYYSMRKVLESSQALLVMEGPESCNRNMEMIWNFIDCDSIVQRMKYEKKCDYISRHPEKFFGQVIGRRKLSTIRVYMLAKYEVGEGYRIIHITYDPKDGTFTLLHSTNHVGEAIPEE